MALGGAIHVHEDVLTLYGLKGTTTDQGLKLDIKGISFIWNWAGNDRKMWQGLVVGIRVKDRRSNMNIKQGQVYEHWKSCRFSLYYSSRSSVLQYIFIPYESSYENRSAAVCSSSIWTKISSKMLWKLLDENMQVSCATLQGSGLVKGDI